MAFKTTTASAAAIAAGLFFVITTAEGTGAFAQDVNADGLSIEAQEESAQDVDQVNTQDIMPVFVENEVVQPLPEVSEEDAAPAAAASLRELVQAMPASGELSEELRCLAGTVYFEARGEPLNGQLAVAQVVINRTASKTFPDSYCGVVHQRAQFSFVKNGRMPRIREGSKAWRKAKAVARIAHQGLWDSAAQDSLYFHATYVRPSWSRKKTRRAAINTHIFYR
ncbi:cell wall hydrolase [Qipengyuania sp. DGS5-3]|uniref:cell wall hydrolase n=1 Tax=Qipengyuania sp. DGS5-3 TaxID=3349632 RepID=UPI0036D34106